MQNISQNCNDQTFENTKTSNTQPIYSTNENINLNERPAANAALRRQPTKYPHGLDISIQTLAAKADCMKILKPNCQKFDYESQKTKYQQKNQINLKNCPENLSELQQVRRFKYPLTGNYQLKAKGTDSIATKSALLMLDYMKLICKWKYLRWPMLLLACVLISFGLINYFIWLHDVGGSSNSSSSSKERQSKEQIKNADDTSSKAKDDENYVAHAYNDVRQASVTEKDNILQDSTILRAISSWPNTKELPQEQRLTTRESNHAAEKGSISWEKQRIKSAKERPRSNIGLYGEEEEAGLELNTLGMPVPNDESLLNEHIELFATKRPAQIQPTSNNFVKVSPTIPPVTPSKPATTATTTTIRSQDSGCYSTSFPLCQGVLDYDLTYNASIQLNETEIRDYQRLVQSNCSARAIEFVCAALEPECMPLHIGLLPPCRRICKAILEACSVLIASSDTLTAIFDCNLYPDSSNPHTCEDPTRRKDYCYANEYQCYDHSCIPEQWQCDNIKDCAAGEDEDSCLICDQPDEYRCRSNEKCIPETARCNKEFDCLDHSDEDDCDSEEDEESQNNSGFDEADLNPFPRLFSYASFLYPTNESQESAYSYITAPTDDVMKAAMSTTGENGSNLRVGVGVSQEEVTNSVPGGLVNFRDSKEIMMTSDSENKFKISAGSRNRTVNKVSSNTTPLKPAASALVPVTTEPVSSKQPLAECAAHQLRCVSGKCITVEQLCDKKIDCPDGFDELMCVYNRKNRTTTASRTRSGTGFLILTNKTIANNNGKNSDKRTIRTTIKRKTNS